MSRETSARIRGFVWFVYPDPATPGAVEGDNPFGVDVLEDETTAPGVVVFWGVDATTSGVHNQGPGRSFLALTESPKAPSVGAGWGVEPARLGDDCALEQRGGRWVRLIRVLDRRETPQGPVAECEFEIDRT